ncbi:flagellar biosynthesis regulator FlaF [Zavarzinia sp. CC-PAN008]|uniref:flagellar biosynthesis regulator FlaF n=1 Tax=Zavarzinia sp. CC-PAN008 TaxID=3243332 RepID=UPI003F748B01
MSVNAYRTAQVKTEDPRSREYRLFAQVTRSLMDVKDGADHRTFADAVCWNRDVWMALATDLSMPGNKLPDALKANLISVAIWVNKHSSAALRGDASIDSLIDVNRSVMAGLVNQQAAPQAGAA